MENHGLQNFYNNLPLHLVDLHCIFRNTFLGLFCCFWHIMTKKWHIIRRTRIMSFKSSAEIRERNCQACKHNVHSVWLTLQSPVVTICTTWCNVLELSILPTEFVCFIWFSQQTAVVSLNGINRLIFPAVT
jgi:hypothetical protein